MSESIRENESAYRHLLIGRKGKKKLTVVDVFRHHFPQLARELDPGRSSSAHDKAQQALPLLLVDRRQRGLFEVVHDPSSDRLCVLDRLQLETVLKSRYTVRRVDGTTCNDELVVL